MESFANMFESHEEDNCRVFPMPFPFQFPIESAKYK